MNIEFILLTEKGAKRTQSAEAIVDAIMREESSILASHSETVERAQMDLF